MIRNERGVAMVTVIFVGMVLTVTISAASFLTVRELQQGEADRRGSDALALAEGGIDRFVNEVRKGTYGWAQIRQAGCEVAPISLPQGSFGRGVFDAQLVVFDPDAATEADRFPPAACATRPGITEHVHVAVTATGQRRAGATTVSTRVVRQVMRIEAADQLPFGVFIEGRIDINGNITMENMSLMTTQDIFGREKIGFIGSDPYYSQYNFYGPGAPDTPIPAAAHAMGNIYPRTGGKATPEHPPNPNCSANAGHGTNGQSLWDSSGSGGPVTTGCGGQTGMPPTSKFVGLYDDGATTPRPPTSGLTEEHYGVLKTMAQANGIYCKFAQGAATSNCTVAGAPRTIGKTIGAAEIAGAGNNFVFYIDLPADVDPFSNAQTISWQVNHSPCSDTPGALKSVVLVIRNGSLRVQGNSSLTGALLMPEGAFDSQGGFTTEGTIVADRLRLRGGATLRLTDCWLRNLPGFLLEVEPEHWSEVDR